MEGFVIFGNQVFLALPSCFFFLGISLVFEVDNSLQFKKSALIFRPLA